ncbi:Uncharacterised protein [Cedecea neteri]|uniref:Uncharacterized protein n=1 Tax=Cedecea neteri TaxID=158822 RepID=A0A2X3JAZ9_9ENTR|nr:Uncharacterised protein [Cedecea neteri]
MMRPCTTMWMCTRRAGHCCGGHHAKGCDKQQCNYFFHILTLPECINAVCIIRPNAEMIILDGYFLLMTTNHFRPHIVCLHQIIGRRFSIFTH